MPKCPVCKTEYSVGSSLCSNCNFADLQRTFISVDEAEYWANTVVRDYRTKWMSSLKDFVFDNSYTELLKYGGIAAHVSVPYGVRVIRDAFYKNPYVQSVDLPDTVEHIGKNAFNSCFGLTTVKIPNGVKTIGTTAFGYCSKLNLVLPESVEEIAEEAFPQVKTIRLSPNNSRYKMLSGMLIDLSKGVLLAVSFPYPLMNVVVPECVRRIGCQAFMQLVNIPNSITLPQGLQSIGRGANVNASSTPVTIPKSVVEIEAGAFAVICEDIHLEEGNTKYIKRNNVLIEKESRTLITVCNKRCTSVRISPAIRKIAPRAFASCKNLTEVKLHGHIEEIGYCAFQSCAGLTSMVIPGSVKVVEYAAFCNCKSLGGIYCEHKKQPTGWHSEWLDNCNTKVYWEDEWRYVPQPIVKK